jgi:hypothetical protein
MQRSRLCARPGCGAPAAAALTFQYGNRTVFLDDLGMNEPFSIDLCAPHADRTAPPMGWTGQDRRMAAARRAAEPGEPVADALRAEAS